MCTNQTITSLSKQIIRLIENSEFNFNIWNNLFNIYLDINEIYFKENVCLYIYNYVQKYKIK